MAYQHPKWLQGIITTAQTKLFQVFFPTALTVWGVYMTATIKDPIIFSVLSIAFFVVWILGILVMQEANYKSWKKILISVIGLAFLGFFVYHGFRSFVPLGEKIPGEKQSITPPEVKPAEQKSIEIKPEIKNGGFESYFDNWTRYERGKLITSSWVAGSGRISDDRVVISTPPPIGDFGIYDLRIGNNLSKGLYIDCKTKPGPELYSSIKQEIHNLKPGVYYKIKFWMKRNKDYPINKESLIIAFDGNWTDENKVFYKERQDGWNEIIIKNPARETEWLHIAILDIAEALILDDISIEGPINE